MHVYIRLFKSMSKSVDCNEFTFHNVTWEESTSFDDSETILTIRDTETKQLSFRCNLSEIEAFSYWK